VAIGRCTEAQATAYRQFQEVTRRTLEEVQPGRPIAAVARRARREIERLGYPAEGIVHYREGHGIGLDYTEPPSIREDVETPLQPGMVLTIEPLLVAEHGVYQVEEIFAVTESGYELLTQPAPPELWVVS
jgi:Xaa-Pro aminopeptidase